MYILFCRMQTMKNSGLTSIWVVNVSAFCVTAVPWSTTHKEIFGNLSASHVTLSRGPSWTEGQYV